jgi:hypothetical protein
VSFNWTTGPSQTVHVWPLQSTSADYGSDAGREASLLDAEETSEVELGGRGGRWDKEGVDMLLFEEGADRAGSGAGASTTFDSMAQERPPTGKKRKYEKTKRAERAPTVRVSTEKHLSLAHVHKCLKDEDTQEAKQCCKGGCLKGLLGETPESEQVFITQVGTIRVGAGLG